MLVATVRSMRMDTDGARPSPSQRTRLGLMAEQVHGVGASDYLRQLRAHHPAPAARQVSIWLTTLEFQASSDLPRAVVFDLDGTLLDGRTARAHLTGPTRDVDAYHRAVATAPPIESVVAVYRACRLQGLATLVVTYRMRRNRRLSEHWLAGNEIDFDAIFMRADGDMRSDYDVKGELLRVAQRRYNVIHALDDNPMVLRLWSDLGLAATAVPNQSYDGAVATDGPIEVQNFLHRDPGPHLPLSQNLVLH